MHPFLPDEMSCYDILTRQNYCKFLAFHVAYLQSVYLPFLKRLFVVFFIESFMILSSAVHENKTFDCKRRMLFEVQGFLNVAA